MSNNESVSAIHCWLALCSLNGPPPLICLDIANWPFMLILHLPAWTCFTTSELVSAVCFKQSVYTVDTCVIALLSLPCLTWSFHSAPSAKIKGERVWLTLYTPLHHITSTALPVQYRQRGRIVCIAFYKSVATCLTCINHLIIQFLCYPHTLTHIYTWTQEGLCMWRLGAAGFYGGIQLLYPSLTFPVGPHPSSQSSTVSLSHAGTIKSGHSSLLFRALKTDERSQIYNS